MASIPSSASHGITRHTRVGSDEEKRGKTLGERERARRFKARWRRRSGVFSGGLTFHHWGRSSRRGFNAGGSASITTFWVQPDKFIREVCLCVFYLIVYWTLRRTCDITAKSCTTTLPSECVGGQAQGGGKLYHLTGAHTAWQKMSKSQTGSSFKTSCARTAKPVLIFCRAIPNSVP
ncbi:hypothetical protein BJX63DRAFT_201974 [Aspergillus granulosus]|uniref:Uncharacterized protein n=1 Tax=Aspergillus granulosus TaxID=176169 RepID=A0ABR4HFQ4_9EURO